VSKTLISSVFAVLVLSACGSSGATLVRKDPSGGVVAMQGGYAPSSRPDAGWRMRHDRAAGGPVLVAKSLASYASDGSGSRPDAGWRMRHDRAAGGPVLVAKPSVSYASEVPGSRPDAGWRMRHGRTGGRPVPVAKLLAKSSTRVVN
jgi:hypothetical protein